MDILHICIVMCMDIYIVVREVCACVWRHVIYTCGARGESLCFYLHPILFLFHELVQNHLHQMNLNISKDEASAS